MRPNLLFCYLILLLFTSHIHAQNPIKVTKIKEEIEFDGLVNEPFWDLIEPIPVRQQIPQFNQPATEKAELRLVYDDQYLYLSGRLFLSKPEYLRPTTFKRDAFDATTDYFGMVIDSYNDKENALAFFTGPSAFRWDGTVANDAQFFTDVSIDWNTFWDVETVTSDTAWYCEMRVPWSSLRFQEKDGKVVMGITVWWYIAAKNEVAMYPCIPMEYGDASQWKPSLMVEYEFEGIKNKKPVYLSAYGLAGLQQNNELNDEETSYVRDNDPTTELGLDLKYSLTSNLTLDLTANTDFAQVEVDDQQVNLTRFSLFFPEKRLFFQERASIFNFSFDNFNRLFYSRRIGIDDGDPLRIYGGARMIGRVGKFDVGFLNMQAEGAGDLKSENFGVYRLRRQVINQYSYVGGILTTRTDFDGSFNTAYGFDGIFRVVGSEYLTAKYAQTLVSDVDNKAFGLKSSRIFLDWERRRINGFFYKLSYSRSGDEYDPGIGFELRPNTSSYSTRFGYGKVGSEDSKWTNWQISAMGTAFVNNTSDSLETANFMPGFLLQAKAGWFVGANLAYNYEYVPETFSLSDDVDINSDTYQFWNVVGTFSTPFQNFFTVLGNATVGGFYDGELVSINLTPRWKINKHLEFELSYIYNYAKFSERNKEFTAHVGRLKAQYLFNTKLSFSAFLQYNSLDEVFVGNVRLRFNPREGNDLFIVYNDLLNSNRSREFPHLPFSSNRAIVLKYTYTFQF